MTSIIEAGHQR